MSFDYRRHLHDTFWLPKIDTYERSLGLTVNPNYAAENGLGPQQHKQLIGSNNRLAKQLRWYPDRTIITENFVALQEVKTRLKDSTYKWAFEIDSYSVAQQLATTGKRVFVIFAPANTLTPVTELKTAWVDEIEFCSKPKENHNGDGSGTLYMLVSENASFLKSLSKFLTENFSKTPLIQTKLFGGNELF